MATTSTQKFSGSITETTSQRFTGTVASVEGQRFTGTITEVGTQRFAVLTGALNGYFRPAFSAGNYFASDFLRGDTLGRSGVAIVDRYSGVVTGNTTQRYTGVLS